MPNWKCKQCGETFFRYSKGEHRYLFCSGRCYGQHRSKHYYAGMFKPGLIPWTKGRKGIRTSPNAGFKSGELSINWVKVGTVKIRQRHSREEGPRAWVKVAEPNIWKPRARAVWERARGPLPRGAHVHHVDGNTMNDRLANLKSLSRSEHMREHAVKRWTVYRAKKRQK